MKPILAAYCAELSHCRRTGRKECRAGREGGGAVGREDWLGGVYVGYSDEAFTVGTGIENRCRGYEGG